MRLDAVNGDYCVTWYCHQDTFIAAKRWCYDEFGDGWGSIISGQLDRFAGGLREFTFKRLYHAQWFMLKWAEL